MKKSAVVSALFFLLFLLSCGDSAVSMMDPEGGSTFSVFFDDPGEVELCHDNMGDLSTAICMFYGMNGRFPDSLIELETVEPGISSLTCPSCKLTYLYDLSSGDDWTVTCPLPVDPNHGHIVNAQSSWPPDPSVWPEICHSNMRSLASACAMFYGMEGRYPAKLSELGTSGIMGNWDIKCPGCGELYSYYSDSPCSTYVIQCPMPTDPTHGYVIDGICYWPQDPSGGQDACRSNMRSLASACAMFYGSEGRYPEKLCELGTSGIMGNWDIPCPTCGEIYHYTTDSTGQTYTINCPMPSDPSHGSVVDGITSWN